MKKIYLSIAAMAIGGAMVFTACKKDDNTPAIVGNWTLSQVGTDSINLGSLDAVEVHAASADSTKVTINFTGDNKFTATSQYRSYPAYSENGTYSLSNGMLVTTTTDSTGSESDTVFVKENTANRLVVLNERSWSVFTK